jgi:hypothetical protein
MKVASLCLLILMVWPGPRLSAQGDTAGGRSGLRLRATVKSLAVEQKVWGSTIDVGLRYELINIGAAPVILWNGEEASDGSWPYTFTGRTLSRTPRFSRADTLDDIIRGTSVIGGPAWEARRRALDQPSPPAGLTTTLWPNQSVAFDAELTLVCNRNRNESIPEHPTLRELEEVGTFWLRTSYQVWSPNLEPDWPDDDTSKLGRKLQRRWKQFGTLHLEDIRTEPIQIDLRAATYKAPHEKPRQLLVKGSGDNRQK